ncbi:hypothetical protein [Dyella caseinilytica]|uniref:Uncharacterized protein n=1 Tax=Dyella caseinilytica TaxID=1849581 RepID=A0ABX7H006_9GAMM|nr:hypothetical protein [Dyella caseinilytica]QRN55242.1 hypothetical protein ISN74_07905 [Dyella caseinilytica]GGA00358.1 hypothetical protein GCM10011408_21590 [Dyella caseinilytica]
MKILKSLSLALVVGLIGLGIGSLDGCATLQADQSKAELVCSNLSSVNATFTAFNNVLIAEPATKVIGTKAAADLAAAQAPIQALCANVGIVTDTQITGALQQVLPAIAAIVATLPLPAATQASIQGGLVAAEGVVGLAGLFESQLQAAQAAKAMPAPASTVASPAQ